MPHFFASNLRAVALPARTKNFEFIFEAKSLRDESAIIFAKSLAKSLHGKQKILLSKQKILLSKQKKGARFLVKFNKHFSTHSKEIIKSALKEYAELVGAEIVAHNLSENKIKVDSAYLLDWRGICALLGGNSPLDLHSADFANLGRFADFSPALRPKFAKNHESQTENPSVVDSARNAQNLGGNQIKIAESTTFCHSERSEESQKKNNRDSSPTAQNDNFKDFAESSLDSAISQNLNKNNMCEAPENSPASWCKKSGEPSSSGKADFLLEAESRGSPPKSEKRQLLGTHLNNSRGEREQGGAALLREESSEISGEGVAESVKNQSVDCNADSANLLAMTENRDFAESPQDARISKLHTQDEFAFLEIGFGSGRHILHLAQKHPSAKIIGLEIYRPAISQVLRQIEILGLQNLYVASIDARVLCEVLPAKCLDRIYLHFPVPWDKNPQRRVLSAQFLGNAMRALKDDGFFELLTDSAEYFAFAKALAKGYKFKAEEGAEGEVVSKYEARWRRQEKVIYRLQIFSNSSLGNSVLGMQFRTCGNFRTSTDSSLVESPKISTNTKATPQFLEFASEAKQPSLPLRFCESQNLGEKNCHSERSEESQKNNIVILSEAKNLKNNQNRDSSVASLPQNDNLRKFAESSLDSANLTPFSPTKICKKEYFLHIKNKYIFEGGVVLFASFGAYYAPSSAYFVICGNEVSTISEIIPTRANIDALGLFMELCFDN